MSIKSMGRAVIEAFVGQFGYRLTPKLKIASDSTYDHENDALQSINLVRKRTMVGYPCLVTLWQQIRYCEQSKIPGCYVECGVWKGGSVGLIALANLAYGTQGRDIHLFDIFDNICEPDPLVDGEKALSEIEQITGIDRSALSGSLSPIEGIYDRKGGPGDVLDVKQFLEIEIGYDPECLHYHKGWFQDTLPNSNLGQIALLRLDGDWYASTKVCLESLYDNVVSGGIVIIDDYGCYDGCKKAVDEFLAERKIRVFLNHVNSDCRYWIKP